MRFVSRAASPSTHRSTVGGGQSDRLVEHDNVYTLAGQGGVKQLYARGADRVRYNDEGLAELAALRLVNRDGERKFQNRRIFVAAQLRKEVGVRRARLTSRHA